MTVVASALELVSARQPPAALLVLLALLLDFALALAELEARTSPACKGEIANRSMFDVKPAKRPIVPTAPISDHRRGENFGMAMLQRSR